MRVDTSRMLLCVCQAPVDWDNTIVSLSLSLYTTCQYLGLCSFSNEAKINYWCWRGQEKALAHARHAVKSTQPPTKTKNKKQKKKKTPCNNNTRNRERERKTLAVWSASPKTRLSYHTRKKKTSLSRNEVEERGQYAVAGPTYRSSWDFYFFLVVFFFLLVCVLRFYWRCSDDSNSSTSFELRQQDRSH